MAQVSFDNTTAAPVDQTRRRFLSHAAGVAAGSTVLAALGAVPAFASTLDGDLRQAADDLAATDLAIAGILRTFGDDAEDREDYLNLEEHRYDCIAALIEIPAASMLGLHVKAEALRRETVIEDYERHQALAVSMADDLIALGRAGSEAAI